MKLIRNTTYLTLLVVCWIIFLSIWVNSQTYAQWDLLKQSFQKVFEYDYAIDKEAEDLFEWWKQKNQTTWESWNFDSVVVRAGRLLIRISVLLAIPMLMYLWIKLALWFGDDSKMREVAKQAWYIVIGIFLAMLCVMIVYFITAFFRTNESFISW
jgi:hypothetical protein